MNKLLARWLLILLVVAAAGVGIGYWRVAAQTNPATPAGSKTIGAAESDTGTLPAQPGSRAAGVDEPSRASAPAADSDPPVVAPRVTEWPESAKDEADARWLASRFYPSERELKDHLYSGEAPFPLILSRTALRRFYRPSDW